MKPGPHRTNLVHILLMEDETTVAHLIQMHLQNRGFSVAIAEDGKKGLQMLGAGHYDLLIIDHAMPVMSGVDVVRALKQRGPMPPILMISGLGRDDIAVEALKLGVMDYVVKDATSGFLERLPVAINEVLKKYAESEAMRAASEERTQWLHELKQRIRELGCLYGIEKLFASEGESIEVVLQAAVNLIPRACRHDDTAWARIHVHDLDFRSDGYADSPWKKSFVLKEMGRLIGNLDVGFHEKPPSPDQDLFTPEEYELLHAVADRLSHFVDRWTTQHQLASIHDELRKLSHAVEQSASAIMITNVRGEIEYVNPKFTEMTGYASAEVLGQNPRILKSGEKGAEEYRDLWQTITSGRDWRGEFHNRKKSGELYWDYSTISPVTNAEGAVTHFIAVKEDGTERKEAAACQLAVLSLSAKIAGSQTEDAICRVVIEGIRSAMGVDRCGLFLGHPNHPPFRGTYGTDLQGQTTDEHAHLWDIGRERDVEELFEHGSFKEGFPLGRPEAMPGEEGLTCTLIALRQAGEVFGVISVDNRITRRPITQAQMIHIAMLAEVLGNALQVARAREALRGSADDARRANEELEAFNRAMVGREGRIIELKEEVNRLLAKFGQAPKYPPVWNESERGPAAPDQEPR